MKNNQDKCSHPACNCRAKEGSTYCSTYCETKADVTEIVCECGHPACKG